MIEFYLEPTTNGYLVESKKIELVSNNSTIIYATRSIAAKAGFSITEEALIATAASELATNIVRYAKKGEIVISIIKSGITAGLGIELFACDRGPGIKCIDEAMEENFSSLESSLGLGLPSVKRIMDEFHIESIIGEGTRILARKWVKNVKC